MLSTPSARLKTSFVDCSVETSCLSMMAGNMSSKIESIVDDGLSCFSLNLGFLGLSFRRFRFIGPLHVARVGSLLAFVGHDAIVAVPVWVTSDDSSFELPLDAAPSVAMLRHLDVFAWVERCFFSFQLELSIVDLFRQLCD